MSGNVKIKTKMKYPNQVLDALEAAVPAWKGKLGRISVDQSGKPQGQGGVIGQPGNFDPNGKILVKHPWIETHEKNYAEIRIPSAWLKQNAPSEGGYVNGDVGLTFDPTEGTYTLVINDMDEGTGKAFGDKFSAKVEVQYGVCDVKSAISNMGGQIVSQTPVEDAGGPAIKVICRVPRKAAV